MNVRFHALALVLLAHVAQASISGLTPAAPHLSATIYPRHLAGTSDGITWFSDERFTPHSVGWFDGAGAVHAFPVPCDKCATGEEITYIFALEPAADGSMWFLYAHAKSDGTHIASRVGQVTRDGAFTTWPVPTTDAFKFSINPTGRSDIAQGPDGNMWFTENDASKIGKITPEGVVTEYPLASFAFPSAIVAGPDGNLWFTETLRHRIGRITTAGAITEFALADGSYPFDLAAAADGTLWYTRLNGTKYGTITTAGSVAEYELDAGHTGLAGIVRGPDDAMWVTLFGSKEIARIALPLSLGTVVSTNSNPVEYCRINDCLAADSPVSPDAGPLDLTFAVLPDSWRIYTTASDGIIDTVLGGRLERNGCALDVFASDDSDLTFAAGRFGWLQFDAEGGVGPYSFTATELPPGMRLDGDTLWGVPSGPGLHEVVVNATDSLGCTGTHRFIVDVQPADCAGMKVKWSVTIPAFLEDEPTSFRVSAEGGTAPYRYDIPGDALGLGIDSSSGDVAGVLHAGCRACSVFLPVRATDAEGCYAVDAFEMVMLSYGRRYSIGH